MAELIENRLQRLASGKEQADAPVAREFSRTGQDKVAGACESHEGFGAPAQRHAEPSELGQPPGDQRCPSVHTEAQAVADAGGDRHDVFHRSADLDAREIRAEIHSEGRVMQFARQALRELSVSRGERERRGTSLSHFEREARTGQGAARGEFSERLGRHMAR